MTDTEFQINAPFILNIVKQWARKHGTTVAEEAAGSYIESICDGSYKTMPTGREDLTKYIYSSLRRRFAEARTFTHLREYAEDGYAKQDDALVSELKEQAAAVMDDHANPTLLAQDPYEAIDMRIDIERALEKATDKTTADAIRKVYLEGYTLQEVSGIQGVPLTTLKSRILATFKELRVFLEGYESMFVKMS